METSEIAKSAATVSPNSSEQKHKMTQLLSKLKMALVAEAQLLMQSPTAANIFTLI